MAECAAAGQREPSVPSRPVPGPRSPYPCRPGPRPRPHHPGWSPQTPALVTQAGHAGPVPCPRPSGSVCRCLAEGSRAGSPLYLPPTSGRPALLWSHPSLDPTMSPPSVPLYSPFSVPFCSPSVPLCFPSFPLCSPLRTRSVPICPPCPTPSPSVLLNPQVAPVTQWWWTDGGLGSPTGVVRNREGPEVLQSHWGMLYVNLRSLLQPPSQGQGTHLGDTPLPRPTPMPT